MRPHAEALAGTTGFDAPAVRAQLADLAARGLVLFAAVFGSLLALAAAAELLLRGPGGLAGERLLLAVSIGAAAGVGALLRARGLTQAAALLPAAVIALAVAAHGWITGLGLFTTALAGLGLLTALAGMLLGLRAAFALSLGHAVLVALLALAESAGWVQGRAALGNLALPERVFGHAMLGLAGLLSAVLLHNLVRNLVLRAVTGQQRLAELLDIGIDWTWEMDPTGRVISISDSFESSTGRPRTEFMQLNQPGGPKVVRDAEYERFMRAFTAGEPYRDVAITVRCADGTLLSVRGNGRPVRDAEGRLVRWLGVSRNITREREGERVRLAADAVLDHAGVGIAVVREGRFERVNPTLEQILDRPAGSLAGQPVATVFDSPADFDDFQRGEAAFRDAGRRADLEREFTRGDGQRVLVRLHARGVGDPQAGGGIIWVAEDITERRRAERELAEAKQQAEAASRAKSAFLAQMSHEIRTPLNGVLGLAQLLQDPRLDAGRRGEYLRLLSEAATQLSGIVSDVLDLTKIEAGQMQLEQVDFDLHELLGSTFEAHAALGRERGLAMTLSLSPGLPRHVRGDPLRVRQILANYLGNALKFTARGSVTLAAARTAEGLVRLEVRDTGVGVSPAQRARLFQPFAQGDSSTTRRYGGTGLGLSICRELATQMGGRVGCDSDGSSEGGSCFWAELPLTEASARGGAERESARPQPLAGQRVLVAEDNPVNLLIVRAMLERQGAQVLEAVDGAEALKLARDVGGRLDAVLMDLHMPTLDGLAATRALRADALTASLPVIALSAAVLEHERRAAAEAGMDGFIAKPVDEAELVRALQQARRP